MMESEVSEYYQDQIEKIASLLPMGQADLAWLGKTPAADQAGVVDSMMRRSEGTMLDERFI